MSFKKTTIVIASHAIEIHSDYSRPEYLIDLLKPFWLELGFEVIEMYGTNEDIPADIVINHVNLTKTPEEYTKIIQSYTYKVNASLRNISKRLYASHLLNCGSQYMQPVMVKTNANYGGVLEMMVLARGLVSDNEMKEYQSMTFLNPHEYKVFASPNHVPSWVWKDDSLIVQKFLPERNQNNVSFLRYWLVFGNQELSFCLADSKDVIKGDSEDVWMLKAEDVPQKLREIRRKMNIDYARFDYVLCGGECILFDINRTPALSMKYAGKYESILRRFSMGIYEYLPAFF